jgi:hypothetical protein
MDQQTHHSPPASFPSALKRAAIRLARPDILFWTLPPLMLLLIIGTVTQKELGLYTAQHTYFSSFIVWLGPIPFPGGYTLMAIFFINLLMKFLLFSEWAWHKAGIVLTHFGVLLLILGGAFTAATEQEGSVVIGQGETTSVIEDYHQREFRILKDGTPVIRIPHQDIEAGMSVSIPGTDSTLKIDTYCFNCAISRRDETAQTGWTEPGKLMQLSATTADPQNEQNLTGVEFTWDGQKYLTFDKFPKPPQRIIDDHTYKVVMGRAERELPFSITLTAFDRQLHPGTGLAKSYRSDITITDGATSWPATITMNEPLRYQGYTLYQSSFDLSGDKPFTVLSAVRNTGRAFPYIASLIMTIGLLLHLVIRLRRREPD